MKEIEVIVDIRINSGQSGLIVVKQKLAMEGGELRLVREPIETPLAITAHREQVGNYAQSELSREIVSWMPEVACSSSFQLNTMAADVPHDPNCRSSD